MHPNDEETQPTVAQVDPDIEKRFTYHAPKGSSQIDRFAQLRNQAKAYAYELKCMTPPSREQSLALTHLEEAVFWSNAAIARNE